jgi:hypothetical protein
VEAVVSNDERHRDEEGARTVCLWVVDVANARGVELIPVARPFGSGVAAIAVLDAVTEWVLGATQVPAEDPASIAGFGDGGGIVTG